MANYKAVRGMDWGGGAIGNAVWSGPRLRDVLVQAGYNEDTGGALHVVADGLDYGPDGTPYGASILIEKALDPRGDVILALQMNGETLPADHGFPVRLVAPGVVGARNVKWVGALTLSKEESYSHWQRKDYKGFNPSIDWHNVDWEDKYAKSIQNLPVQSMITEPLNGSTVPVVDGKVKLRGYAYSGGGSKVIRVDVTLDKGETWHTAELEQDDSQLNRCWSWTLWEIEVPVPDGDTLSAQCCAIDANYNRQPENIKNIWNLRGALSNAWHTINVKLQK